MTREDREELVARLMAEGLDHYGHDRVDRAVACWRQVLDIAPGHPEASDYLRSAGYEDPAPASARGPGGVELTGEARQLFQAGRARDALELLESLDRAGELPVQGLVELIRSHLFVRLLARTGQGEHVPRLRLRAEEILKFNLPAGAGFLLSMVDGATSVNDIVALAGMDPFEALQILERLADAGIVEMAA